MGVFDIFKKTVAEQYVARPAGTEQLLIYRYPEQGIPNGAKLTVRADETAVFFREGQFVGELSAGAHHLASENIPFLNTLVIAPFTDGNHYITEVFFVRRTEHLHTTGPRVLGRYTDSASKNLVSLQFVAQFGVRVKTPQQLILSLGGMQAGAAAQVAQFLDARVSSLLAQVVAQVAATEAILRLVSNEYSEQLGRMVIERAAKEFTADGLELARFLQLELALDAESDAALRAYGKRMSELNVQRAGAQLATEPGFEQYNMTKARVAVMEGLGEGLSKGNAGMMPGMGMGLGVPVPGMLSPLSGYSSQSVGPSLSLPPAAAPARSVSTRYYLRGRAGIEGPYNAHQLVLRASSSNFDAESALVRRAGEDDWHSGGDIDEVAAEFERRVRSSNRIAAPPTTDATSDAFEKTLATAAFDKVITPDEHELLAGLALSLRLKDTIEAARDYVVIRAQALGCAVPSDGVPVASAGTASAPTPSVPTPPSTAPTEPPVATTAQDALADLERQLGGLDQRLAEGKISEETYKKVADRLEARIAQLRAGAPV